jgi:glycosyltransferase involved in cell wall biosynthesis
MRPLSSVIFDSRFLDKKSQSGIARDSNAFLKQFIKNEWSVNLLQYEASSPERGDGSTLPTIRTDKSLVRVTAEAMTLGKSLKTFSLDANYFYLSQVSPIKVETKKSNCKRIIRIHDLFPITNPNWFTPMARLHFKAGLNSISADDILITNSKTTTISLVHVMKGRISPEQVMEVSCPSTEFKISKPCKRCELCINFQPMNDYFLAVGTIEPRKNYTNLLIAWEKSKPNNSGFKLVVVGNLGWHDKKIERQLSAQKDVLHLKGICDYQLHELYKNAFAFVSASLNEGFNIPLHEAQTVGSRLVLSDIKIHHEFATEDTVAWFDPLSIISITSALNDSMNVPIKNPGKTPRPSFEDQFKHFLVELLERPCDV